MFDYYYLILFCSFKEKVGGRKRKDGKEKRRNDREGAWLSNRKLELEFR